MKFVKTFLIYMLSHLIVITIQNEEVDVEDSRTGEKELDDFSQQMRQMEEINPRNRPGRWSRNIN